ncbi:MAG: helix-hairpin-helix domain-containing protein [Calditrichaceae bacterium]|nr:helix-hairpin-helix domain-containing protein [Calditrichaceae bacterium]MBN2708289.1 helix-hairpin-helix domain-containing protein [Calditrichaceae bacterium]RQV91931.1 MAG: hypothetical protein EH224_17020 [Calditrichota bacterium]
MSRSFCKLFIVICMVFITARLSASNPDSIVNFQIDVNHASLEEISRLPVDEKTARAIYDRVLNRGYFTSIYQLKEIEGIDQELFNKLKPLIRIEPLKELTSVQEKIEQIYYQLDRWNSDEGLDNAFIDLWIERALSPMNVNNMNYDDLVNLRSVSPVDAVAILKHRPNVHWIRNERDLRSVPGLSNYAWRSIRYFVDYKDQDFSAGGSQWHGNIIMRVDNTPFMADEAEQSQEASLSTLTSSVSSGFNYLPNTYLKGRLTYKNQYKIGFSFTRNLNEPTHYLNEGQFRIPEGKFYLGMENTSLGPINLDKLYIGNYSVTFGQGIIMENTDFFAPRKSGYGFRKRFRGISGDISQTRQYKLTGAAAEISYQNLSATGFFSMNDRDAILNRKLPGDSSETSFNQLIVLDQRFFYALDDSMRDSNHDDLSWLNAVREMTYGGHLQYTFMPGAFLGLTFYESAYDRPIEPDPYQIVGFNYDGNSQWNLRQVTADSEIKQSYGGAVSRGSNPFWPDAKSFRRVFGFDFQTVVKNVAFQGEYAQLDKGGRIFSLGENPQAYVVSAYTQFSSFNILFLYRNYDIAFDNPYQRSFSNYRRYKGTMFEDYYYLQSVLYGQLYASNPQPQSEEGFYIDSYYQISRKFTAGLQYDNWTRKPDAAKMYRLVGTLNYSPIYPVSFQIRHKWQAREEDNRQTTSRYYTNNELRARMLIRLSGYNSIAFMYSNSKVINLPRPRIFNDIVLDGEAITANYIHNFNQYLKFSGMLSFYKGFLWNFEDTQFVVVDSDRGAFRYWMALYARLSHNLAVRMKYTGESHIPLSGAHFSASNYTQEEYMGKMFNADWQRKFTNLYYLEFSYNF